MMKAALKGADKFSRMLARKAQAVQKAVKQVQNETGDAVVKGTQRRAKARRGVTAQDHRSAVNPRPPRVNKKRLAGGGMGVQMGGQWGHARDPIVIKMMKATGYGADLIRKHLWVEQPLIGGGVLAPEKMRFDKTPWLEEWGEREDRGQQRRRHAVRLPPEVRMRLSLSPALMERQEEYVRALEVAFLRGITPGNVAGDL